MTDNDEAAARDELDGAPRPRVRVAPIAATLHLCCPACGTQLLDRIGPFWCPKCQAEVSAWPFVAALMATAAARMSGGDSENPR